MHMLKYKLWEEQNKQSPYTRKSISIAKLFTSEYEIDHIIPQKRYFDDSFTNKVVCESAVNKDKGARLFIRVSSCRRRERNFAWQW